MGKPFTLDQLKKNIKIVANVSKLSPPKSQDDLNSPITNIYHELVPCSQHPYFQALDDEYRIEAIEQNGLCLKNDGIKLYRTNI